MALTEDMNVTYVCDNEGKKIGVVLSTERYEKLLEFERIVKHIYNEVSGTSSVCDPEHAAAKTDSGKHVTRTADNETSELFIMTDSSSDSSVSVSESVSASDNNDQNGKPDRSKEKETDNMQKDSEGSLAHTPEVNADNKDSFLVSSDSVPETLPDKGAAGSDSGTTEQSADLQQGGHTDLSAGNPNRINSEPDAGKDDYSRQTDTAEAVKETEKVPSETAVTSEKTRKSEKARKNGTPDSGKSASDSEEKSSAATADKKQKAKKNGGSSDSSARRAKTRASSSEITFSSSYPEETIRLMDEMKLIKKFNLESVIVNDVPHIKFKYASTKPGTKNNYESYGYFTFINSKKCFVVMKGSIISKNCADSVRNTVKEERTRLINEGIVTETEDELSLCYNSSVPYNSPSLAASVISGSNRSGFDAWRASNGLIMKKLIEDGNDQADTDPHV